MILLLTDRPDALLATIRSRCQRIDFAYAAPVRSADTLAVRAAFARCVARSTGAPRRRSSCVEGLEAALDAAGAASEAAAAAELEELDADIEARGYPPRTAAALRRRLGERQRQELRRAKTDALIEGISAIEQTYLDVLAGAAGALSVDPARAADAARRVPVPPGRPTSSTPTSARCCCTWCRSCRPSSERREVRSAEVPSVHCRTPPG